MASPSPRTSRIKDLLLEKANLFEADMKVGLDHCGEDAAIAEADTSDTDAPFIVDAPRITTMTVQVTITQHVSLKKLNANFANPEVTAYAASAFPSTLVMKTGKSQDVTRASFYNCIIFTYRNISCSDKRSVSHDSDKHKASNPAIKVFSNGTLHITGLKTITEVLAVSELFCRIFDIVSDDASAPFTVEDFSVEDFRVQLVNSHFKIPSLPHISLDTLHRHLLTETQHLCRYNRENHAGLIIRMDLDTPGANVLRHISVIIFESGNVLISAFTHSSELIRAYEFVTGFLKKHFKSISSTIDAKDPNPVKRRRRTAEGFDYGKYIMLK